MLYLIECTQFLWIYAWKTCIRPTNMHDNILNEGLYKAILRIIVCAIYNVNALNYCEILASCRRAFGRISRYQNLFLWPHVPRSFYCIMILFMGFVDGPLWITIKHMSLGPSHLPWYGHNSQTDCWSKHIQPVCLYNGVKLCICFRLFP